jgi:hypothetical protein
MREPKNQIEELEWAHRRLLRARKLIEDGLIQKLQTPEGQSYVCQSQSHPQERYLVERESCPCKDEFQLNGQKLCKHILARLILEDGIDLQEIGKDPIYWQRKTEEPEGQGHRQTLRPSKPGRILPGAGRRNQRLRRGRQ